MKDAFTQIKRNKLLLFLKSVFSIYLIFAGLSQFEAEQIGEKSHAFIKTVMGSLFTQKWTMFAPRPLSFSQQVQYQCRQGESKKIWLESLKANNSKMSSITRQKMIFYFEDYLSIINVEIESLQKHGAVDVAKEFSKYSMSLPAIQDLAILLSKECNGQVPESADFVKIWIKPEITERFHLWGT